MRKARRAVRVRFIKSTDDDDDDGKGDKSAAVGWQVQAGLLVFT
jgi:hypothetical protein